ncbi:DUF948 domain-containing protein [Leptolyngbya sp. AN03gr2]|uniref:DUF948 domain-containing protein n=1 Tax=unclassified Leptolyngbya TaxID=2650499 RepID=UPI003D30F242
MADPIFWLGLSILLVAISLTALLTVAIPAFNEMGRAARSAEKLFDTLNRELPPTLEALRLTGLEVTDLTDDMTQGVQSATQVVKQVDQSITGVKQQVQKAQTTSKSVFAGMKAAWRTFSQPNRSRRSTRLASNPEKQTFFRDDVYAVDRNGDHHDETESILEVHYEREVIDERIVKPPESPRQSVRSDQE